MDREVRVHGMLLPLAPPLRPPPPSPPSTPFCAAAKAALHVRTSVYGIVSYVKCLNRALIELNRALIES